MSPGDERDRQDPRTVLHADMDAFFARVEKLDRPELEGRPVIVGGLGKRGVVSTACYRAREFGVHSAMPMEEARRLCPGASFLSPRGDRYREIAERVRVLFRSFTPVVQPVSLDEAYLDVTGVLHRHDSPRALGESLRGRIRKETGLRASVGIAPARMVAKIASDRAKPDGLRVVDSSTVREFLADLPVGEMPGIGPRAEERFHAAGYETLGDLQRASPDELYDAFGERAVIYRRRAEGHDDSPVSTEDPAKSISHERTFERDLTRRERLEDELFELVEKVAARLRDGGREARTVFLKLRRGDFTTINRQTTAAAFFTGTGRIWRAARELLRNRVELDDRGVRLLGVGVRGLRSAGVQGELFEDDRDRRFERADRLMDRINEQFGPGTLEHARELDSSEEDEAP